MVLNKLVDSCSQNDQLPLLLIVLLSPSLTILCLLEFIMA